MARGKNKGKKYNGEKRNNQNYRRYVKEASLIVLKEEKESRKSHASIVTPILRTPTKYKNDKKRIALREWVYLNGNLVQWPHGKKVKRLKKGDII